MSDLRLRLSKIVELHGPTLAEAVGEREPESKEALLSDKDLILRFAGSDPTDGKSRTQWLVKTYIRDEYFKLEDLGRVGVALAAFERFKRKLPVEQRELSQFKKLRDLEALVDPFVKAEAKARLERDLSSATGREKRRLEELKARDESIVVQEGEGILTIAVPMTEFASKWWGRGTQWCTAAENHSAFMTYNKNAPLVIIVCPDGAKFQMHVTEDHVQFMDNTDKKVSQETIEERWNEFKPLLDWMLKQNGQALQFMPKRHRTPELYRLVIEHIKQNGLTLSSVPNDYKTLELCYLAVAQNGMALEDVPEKYKTTDLYRIAIEQYGLALYSMPRNQKTPELCRLAIQKDGWALGSVPEEQKTLELCRSAVEQDGLALGHVPTKYKAELCRLAIEQDGRALGSVPEEQKTLELYRSAVEQDGRALQYVTTDKRTPELCRIAVEQNGLALYYVPEKYQTSKLCHIAVVQDGRALQFIRPEHKTYTLCHLAVEQDGRALGDVPAQHRTPELCRIAIQQNGDALLHVPKEFQTPEFLALIPSVQPKWHPDILQGLGQQPKLLQDSITNNLCIQ
jgi:hypothetical protein